MFVLSDNFGALATHHLKSCESFFGVHGYPSRESGNTLIDGSSLANLLFLHVLYVLRMRRGLNYEYVLVSKKQAAPETAVAIRRFLHWASAPDEANAKLLDDAQFIPLPPHIWVLTYDQIEQIR